MVDDSVCNNGKTPLIVSWPKTGIANDAYSPLPPGSELYNQFSIGPREPTTDSVVLRYGGYTSADTQTTIYHAPEGKQAEQSLHSGMGARLTYSPRSSQTQASFPPSKEARDLSFEINVDATPTSGKGYELVAAVKATQGVEVRLAISTAENAKLAKALQAEGMKTDVVPLPKLARIEKDSNFATFVGRSFVPISMPADGSPIKVFVPGEFKEVEEAPLLLLVGVDPVLAGKVSLFK